MALTIQQIQSFIDNKTLNERQLINLIADFLQANQSGSNDYLVASATLTDAQIKTLPSTGMDIIPIPKPNQIISIINAVLSWNISNGGYTNVRANAITFLAYGEYDFFATSLSRMMINGDSTNRISILQQGTVDFTSGPWIGYAAPQYDGIDNSVGGIGKKISLWSDNQGGGNFTGGNAANTLKVTVYYVVVDL